MNDEPKEIWAVESFVEGQWAFVIGFNASEKDAADRLAFSQSRKWGLPYRVRRYVPDTVVAELVEALAAVWSYPGVAEMFAPEESLGSVAHKVITALLHTTSKT